MISSAFLFFVVTGKRQLQTEVLATDAHGSILQQKNPLAEMAVGNSLALARQPEVTGGEPQSGYEVTPEMKAPIEVQGTQAQEAQEAHNAQQAHAAETQQSIKINQNGMPTKNDQEADTETQMSQMLMQPPGRHQQYQQAHHVHQQYQLAPEQDRPLFAANPRGMPGVANPAVMLSVTGRMPVGMPPPGSGDVPGDQKQATQAEAQSSPIVGIIPDQQLLKRGSWNCDITHDQSPVDLPLDNDTAPPAKDRNFANHFFYDAQSFPSAWFVNNGRSLTLHTNLKAALRPDVKKSMTPKKGSFGTAILPATSLRVYNLNGIRLHFPSEHSVEGRFFAGEIHLVHQSNDGKELIVSILVDPQVNNNGLPRLEHFIHPLVTVPRVFTKAKVDVNVDTLHQIMMGPYWRYHGSSTVPPCEPADWIVFRTPIGVDVEILKHLANALPVTVNRPRIIHALGQRKFYKNLMDGAESLKVSMALFAMIAALWI